MPDATFYYLKETMNIYVGNLPFSMEEAELQALFEAHGSVSRVNIVMDRETGRPRGFAFVEMPDDAQAQAAIEAVNGTQVGGRAVTANQARPREERGGSRGGGRLPGRRGGDTGAASTVRLGDVAERTHLGPRPEQRHQLHRAGLGHLHHRVRERRDG